MPLQMSSAPSHTDQIVDLRSIDVSGIDRRRLERAKSAGRFAQDGVVLSLVHLDVALAVKAEGSEASTEVPCFKVSAKRLAPEARQREPAVAVETRDDPVIQRLTDALAAAESAHDSHSAICADALRLAILTRQFTQQAELQRGTVPTDEQTGRSARSLQKWRLKRVLDYVEQNLAEKISLQDLATVAGLSRMHFAAQFRAAMGMRPHEYLLKRRIERAEELLKQNEVSLVEVALMVGFQTQAHFTTVFKRFAGDTPYQWRSAYLAQSAPLPPARRSLS